ncbi:histone-like nucleoid-structuring protein Lsr2 [Planobispora siamensis]|uniref:Lsr2 DNA-binding domain-containing protein n=1 Tax=Planobispora siamensis TaxID=936338 RepID=A0A8J3SNM5_9ACTN|nr:histone-like nucleoid-structuring protein Lsr2 [Planobispora siamensis]GIH97763.1 hypothetical protein Psi01_83930 [Planobispora siamensis]
MPDGFETSWERLRRLSEMSAPERIQHVSRWAEELTSRDGMDGMLPYFRTAHQEMIAAVLLALVDHGWSSSNVPVSEASALPSYAATGRRADRSDEAPIIRAWARDKGLSISERGRIPQWVVDRYHTESATQEPSSDVLALKIRQALQLHGELTRSDLWNIVGRNQPSLVITKALDLLPDVEAFEGESTGGRPPLLYRLTKDVSRVSEATPSSAPSERSELDPSVHDFLQMLHGESHDA